MLKIKIQTGMNQQAKLIFLATKLFVYRVLYDLKIQVSSYLYFSACYDVMVTYGK